MSDKNPMKIQRKSNKNLTNVCGRMSNAMANNCNTHELGSNGKHDAASMANATMLACDVAL
jgi:hypothetical protein